MPKSREKILDTAQECFFQHGYAATSIAMISRYASISRVTIHKQFSSKEALFRALITDFLVDKDVQIQEYLDSDKDFWQSTCEFLTKRCTEVFEDIPNPRIKTELLHAGQTYCADLIDENEGKTGQAMLIKLKQTVSSGSICLEAIGLSVEEFADNIHKVAEGIMMSTLKDDPREVIKTTLNIYQKATQG
ncbi:TetR/AcrR family transcriptional regulator [Thalassotalea sp. PLHSN55]|uniref:TetR/AcrR family transcriptional regulator n=1 Tax=Thalassotalea sp. PLHSN55 TaxID=3435888 RepID=UPI003F875F5A